MGFEEMNGQGPGMGEGSLDQPRGARGCSKTIPLAVGSNM
jgi:hypothetical protein